MNTDKIDLEALDRDAPESARQPQSCCCFGKRKCCRWASAVLLMIVLGGGGVYWAFFTRVYHLDVYQTAMRQIESDQGLQQQLGQPIKTAGWPPPSPRLEESEKDIRWPIAGPKGSAKAHVSARLMQGKWEIVQLEVVLANGKKVSVADAGDGEAVAPRFEAPKTETKKPETNAPAPEINLPVPPDGPGK